MTAGSPTGHRADRESLALDQRQAADIRRLLAQGMDAPTAAAQVRCTLRRVQDVAQAMPASGTSAPPSAPQAVDGIPTPRKPAQRHTGGRKADTDTPYRLSVAPAEPARATRARLVRHIAADPVLLAWLYEHNARIIDTLADALLVEHGQAAAATALRVAQAHRAQQAPPWGNPNHRDQPSPDARCGEQRGYQAHLRRGESPCDDCRAANTAYHQHHRRRTDRQEQSA